MTTNYKKEISKSIADIEGVVYTEGELTDHLYTKTLDGTCVVYDPSEGTTLVELILKYKVNISHSELSPMTYISINGSGMKFQVTEGKDIPVTVLKCIVHSVVGVLK